MNILIQTPDDDFDAINIGLTIAKRLVNEGWHESGKDDPPRKEDFSGWPYVITSDMGKTGLVVLVERV